MERIGTIKIKLSDNCYKYIPITKKAYDNWMVSLPSNTRLRLFRGATKVSQIKSYHKSKPWAKLLAHVGDICADNGVNPIANETFVITLTNDNLS